MLNIVKYINHLNEEFDFNQNGVSVQNNDLRDFTWTYSSDNGIISNFQRKVITKQLPIYIFSASNTQANLIKNKLFETLEIDILSQQSGKLIFSGYYLNCFPIAKKISENFTNENFSKYTLTFAINQNTFWTKETTTQFRNSASTSGKNLDFPFDYSFDYASVLKSKTLINKGIGSSNFNITIYGPAVAPTITIGEKIYSINANIESNEHLQINSQLKTITLVKIDGKKENYYPYRDRENYIFTKIPNGENWVTWNGDFGFDVNLLDERSEPMWT